MAEYVILNTIFTLAVLTFVILFSRAQIFTKSLFISLGILLLLTAVFDNLIINSGIVSYDENLISGIKIGKAPIEDFMYSVVAIVFVPFVFEKIRART